MGIKSVLVSRPLIATRDGGDYFDLASGLTFDHLTVNTSHCIVGQSGSFVVCAHNCAMCIVVRDVARSMVTLCCTATFGLC